MIQVASLTSLLGVGSKAAMISVRQLILSLLAMLTASGVLAVFLTNPEFIGSQALIIRAAILDCAILLVLTAIYPLAPVFVKRPDPTALWFASLHCFLRFCILAGCYRSAVREKFREIS